VINFGLIYGMSAFGLAKQLGIERSAAQAYIDRYFARYPGVALHGETRAGARAGLRRDRVRPPPVAAGDPVQQVGRRQGAERAAINAPMQGTAADLIKLAMIAVPAG
jgi:DNA polymerase-1